MHDGQRHLVVAARLQVCCIAVEVASGLAVGGHVGLLALHPGALPALVGTGAGFPGSLVEALLLRLQEDAARLRRDLVDLEVVA